MSGKKVKRQTNPNFTLERRSATPSYEASKPAESWFEPSNRLHFETFSEHVRLLSHFFFLFLHSLFFLSPFRSLSICRLFFSGSFHCLRFLILCRLNVLFDFPNSFVVSFVSFHLFYLSPFSFLFLFSSGCPCTYVCILSLSPSFSFRPFLPVLNHTFLLLLLPFFLFGSGA